MPDGGAAANWAQHWLGQQEVFWAAAAKAPRLPDSPLTEAFAPPDWQAFDGFAAEMLHNLHQPGGLEPDEQLLQQAYRAVADYRDVIAATWTRVAETFEIQRRAMQGLRDPDWRIVRDRWFQVAEAEFITTLRSSNFLDAQRKLLRAVLALWAKSPMAARTAALQSWHSAQIAGKTLASFDLDGVAIAQTPKDVVWAEGKTTLFRYRTLDGRAPSLGPVVICHGLIGRQTMTDIQPDRSLVRMLLASGVDVFTIDWGNADSDDVALGLDHFAGQRIAQCLAAARAAASGMAPVLFGICQGGTMAACYAARHGQHLRGLITAVAPIDFHGDLLDPDPAHGLLHLWLRSFEQRDIDALLAIAPNLPGVLLGAVFNQLNPVRTLAKYAVSMAEQSLQPGGARMFLAMEKWLMDRPDLPGAMAQTWLNDLYRDNALVIGTLMMDGEPVDLTKIEVPVLNIFATGDHITPPSCSRALGQYIRADYQEFAVPAGHIGTFVSAKAQTLLSPAITAWLAGRS